VSRGPVLREDLGSKPLDARIARSDHQGSHEFARDAVVLPFVGHEDRDLSGGGVGLVSGVARHAGNATVIDCDHRLVSPYLEVELSVEIRFGSSARAARSSPDSGRIRRASDEEFDM
jgi:hypothetical protein